MASSRLRPLSWCRVCRCSVEQVVQLFVAAVGVFDPFGQLALVVLDHLLLLAELVGLLLERVLPLVEQPLALVQFLPELGQLVFAFGLLLDGQFFDFQLGLFAAVGLSRSAPLDDLAGFGFRIAAAEPVENLVPTKVNKTAAPMASAALNVLITVGPSNSLIGSGPSSEADHRQNPAAIRRRTGSVGLELHRQRLAGTCCRQLLPTTADGGPFWPATAGVR